MLSFRLIITFVILLVLSLSVGKAQDLHGLPLIQNYSPLEYGSHRQNWQIAQAPDGTLYFANGKGILSYNGEKWHLTMVPNRGHIRSLTVAPDGTVYAGANNDFGKLIMQDTEVPKFQSYLSLIDTSDHNFGRVRRTIWTPEGVFFQSYNRIFRIKGQDIKIWRFPDSCYRLFWLNEQLYVADLKRGLLQLRGADFSPVPEGEYLSNKRVSLAFSFGNKLLFGTRAQGLFLYNYKQFEPFQTELDDQFKIYGLANGLITSNNKIVLAANAHNGLYILDKSGKREWIINQSTGLASSNVLNVYEDEQSSLWVGLQEGIARIDINAPYSVYDDLLGLEGTIQKIRILNNQIYAASSQGVVLIQNEKESPIIRRIKGIDTYCWDLKLWNNQLIVACNSGAYSIQNQQAKMILDRSNFTAGITPSVYEDQTILIASDDGLIYQIWNGNDWVEQGRIDRLNGSIRTVIEADRGLYWLKTRSNGIFRIRLRSENGELSFQNPIIEHFNYSKGVPRGENNIFKFQNKLLVRSEVDSLHIYNPNTNRFDSTTDWGKIFGIKEGLVLPKTEEENGQIWLDCYKNNKQYLIKAEKRLDGSYAIEEFPFSIKMQQFKDPHGNEVFAANAENAWFGGMRGILQTNLQRLKYNIADPVKLLIYGVPKAGTTLPYSQNDLSFDFAAPSYQNADKLQYATFLNGYDQGWSVWTKEAHKNYTNLPEGDYVFQVKAKNDFHVESKIVTYSFTIRPPWYRSTLAWVAYVLIAGLSIWLILYLRSTNLRKEQARLAQLVKERTQEIENQAKEINELYQVKNRFLANISHELRTPLTLILGPTEHLLASTKEGKDKQHLSWIHQNSQRLLKLINQLLDLSKIEAGQLRIKCSQQDLVKFCQYILSIFESLAKQKNLQLHFKAPSEPIFVYFDPEKLEKVLTNLLFNAFKFTEKGSITIQIESFPDKAKITVTDTGIGIHEQQIPYIFDRFYQATQGKKAAYEGTGIGLALCKELIELHSGKIEVTSEIDKGSQFSIFLPLGRTHLKEDEIKVTSNYLPPEKEVLFSTPILPDPEPSTKDKLSLVLLIDDNQDILSYIQLQLKDQYRFVQANNGDEGLEIAQRELPDLIVSDVMMPGKNGFEVCSHIKNDIKTDHIPIILLTARNDETDKIHGLTIQADEYLQKPFNLKELAIRMQNLIQNRKLLRKRFADKITFRAADIAETPQEELFLQQLIDAVEENLSNTQFDLDRMCKIMGMSKSQLNRKMRAVLNKSPNQYIRSYRLERAHQLIKTGNYSITEIAYDVGFSSPAYFTKCFHDEFGYPPSAVAG